MTGVGRKALVIEDEKQIVDIVSFHLRREGFETLVAYDGAQGLQMALKEAPDIILLDVMLPEMDGFAVCRELRKTDPLTPVLMLTAREDESDKVLGLELGADDYITKPFGVKELMARVRANVRRSAHEAKRAEPEEVLTVGGISLHTGRMSATVNGAPVELSQREYDLLYYLISRLDRVVSREELMENVWNFAYYGDLRAVDVAVRRLREKIEANPAEPVHILTRRGAGYLFASGKA